MQLRTTFLSLMLLSNVSLSAELSSGSEESPKLLRHLREPSGKTSTTSASKEVFRLSKKIGTMNERQLLAALKQDQSFTEEKPRRDNAYEELYALASLKPYTESFMAEVQNPLIARLIFRPTEEGESTLVFPKVLEDLQSKIRKDQAESSLSPEQKYEYYRNNVRLLLQTWGTITICGEKLFDDTISKAISLISDQADKEKNSAGMNLIKEVTANIQTFINFFNKWGDFITDMITEQRRSLLIAKIDFNASKPKGHKSLSSGSEPGTTSVTQQASLISFDVQPILARLTSQLEDAYLCLGLTYEKPKKVLKSSQWQAVQKKIEERKLEREAIEQQETAESSPPKVERKSSQSPSSRVWEKQSSKTNLKLAGSSASSSPPSSAKAMKKTTSKWM